MEQRGEFRASQLSDWAGRPRAFLDSDRLTMTVSVRMANAQARLESLAITLQHGIFRCQNCRIRVFVDVELPGRKGATFWSCRAKGATFETVLSRPHRRLLFLESFKAW